MKISSMLSEQEIQDLLQEFYQYFETGYDFEEFLKEYLLKMGLDEVQVTQRSRDGGIDLIAIRKGVGDFSEIDTTHYFIQAKRNGPRNKVNVHVMRECKGVIPFGYKGMLITTSDFTADAKNEAVNDPSKPVVAINGKDLVMSCIDNEIGFIFKPKFSKTQMDLFCKKEQTNVEAACSIPINIDFIEKTITSNDIRARIISIPSAIMRQFNDTQTNVDVVVNEDKIYNFNIIRGRNYFGGVTTFLKDYKLLSDEGLITPKNVKWLYIEEEQKIKFYIEE